MYSKASSGCTTCGSSSSLASEKDAFFGGFEPIPFNSIRGGGGCCLADVLAGSINTPAVAGLLEVTAAVVGRNVVCVYRCEGYMMEKWIRSM